MKSMYLTFGVSLICILISNNIRGSEIIFNQCIVNVSNLALREKPANKSYKIAILFKGKKLYILEENVKEETVNDVKGYWYKVKTNQNKIGYVFSAEVFKVEGVEKRYDKTDFQKEKYCTNKEKNIYKCSTKIEKELLNIHSDIIRKGNSLILKLENGKELNFTDHDEGTINETLHVLRGYLEEINYYILYMTHNNGWSYFLINKKNGEMIDVGGFPHCISLDKKNIVILLNYRDFPGYGGFQIINVKNPKPEKSLEYDFFLIPYNATWINNEEFIIDVYSSTKNKYYQHKIKVFKQNNKWCVED